MKKFPVGAAAKPFEEVPGPKALPIIGTLWRRFPFIGDKDTLTKMHIDARNLKKRYGLLVRENVVADRTIVHVFDPRDIETVFRHEGRYPTRLSHRALHKYRMEKPDLYRNGGLFSSNGPDWAEIRSKFQVPLARRKTLELYKDHLHDIADDLIQAWEEMNLLNGEHDLTPTLSRWALEATGVLALDTRIGCLRLPIDNQSDDRPQRLMAANEETNRITMLTENAMPFQRHWEKKLAEAQDTVAEIVAQYLKEKPPSPSNAEDATVLQQFFSLASDKRDVYTMIMDMFLAGNDTTTYAMTYLLYQLAKNPDKQQRLREELLSIVESRPSVPALEGCSYLRACCKESHRLMPIAIGTGRILETDVTLSGHTVPAGSIILVHTQTASRDPSSFADPDDYVPERWLRTSRRSQDMASEGTQTETGCPHAEGVARERKHPLFALLPFGHGPRMCIARKFAESVINTLTFKIITNYSIEYTHDKPMDCFTRLINVPDQPLKLKFTKFLESIHSRPFYLSVFLFYERRL